METIESYVAKARERGVTFLCDTAEEGAWLMDRLNDCGVLWNAGQTPRDYFRRCEHAPAFRLNPNSGRAAGCSISVAYSTSGVDVTVLMNALEPPFSVAPLDALF